MTGKFKLGQLVATPGVLDSNLTAIDMVDIINRHASCDWGEVCEEDKQLNNAALTDGLRLLSAYTVNGTKFWIITEADRSVTTILLPEEY